MFRISDLLKGASRGSADAAIAFVKHVGGASDYADVIREVYRLAPEIGLDAGIVVAQMVLETDWFRSLFFVRDGNTGGLGIDGDNRGNHTDQSPFLRLSGKRAACVHLATLWIKIHGPSVVLPTAIAAAATYAPAWLARVRRMAGDGHWPGVRTIDDLNTHFESTITGDAEATWAWDEQYQTKLVARATQLFPGAPDWKPFVAPSRPTSSPSQPKPPASGGGSVTNTLIVFGRVPHPPFLDRPITKVNGVGMNLLGKREVWGIVLHRMIGSLWGTNQFFNDPTVGALTDYGVGTTGTDGKASNGTIIRWNDPRGWQSGWASGRVVAPYGDGLRFVNQYAPRYGLDAVNRFQASIEISGLHYEDPVTEEALQAVAALIAYWADQRKIRWSDFPIGPEGYSFLRWHQEFTIGTGKVCPGAVVMEATDRIIAFAKEIMRRYQTAWPTKRIPVAGGMALGLKLSRTTKNQFKCVKGMWGRTGPSLTAPRSTTSMLARTRLYTFDYQVTVNGEQWLVTKAGTWAIAAHFQAVGRV